jgi:hypothetical protein
MGAAQQVAQPNWQTARGGASRLKVTLVIDLPLVSRCPALMGFLMVRLSGNKTLAIQSALYVYNTF